MTDEPLATAAPDHCPDQRDAVVAFGSYALGEPDLDDLLAEASRLAAEGMGSPFARVMQYRDSDDDLVLRAGHGWPEGVVGRAKVPADLRTPTGRTFVTGEPVLVEDVRDVPDFDLPRLYADHGIVSSVCVPIRGSDGPFGTLGVDATEPRRFSDDDVAFLTGFANVIAEAVARLRRKKELRRALRENRRIARERAVLLRELQHRARNNLQQVQSLLSLHASRTSDPDARRGFENVARQVMALAALYDHLLGVGLARSLDFGDYVATLCRRIADVYEPVGPGGVALDCRTVPVDLDLDRATTLGLVANELLANAYEHAFPEGAGRIGVALRADAGAHLVLTISDDGAGLPAGHAKGIGLGLAERLVQQLGGTLDGVGRNGTTWTVRVPR